MNRLISLLLLGTSAVFGQREYKINNASTIFNVVASVQQANARYCGGEATFKLFRKRSPKSFQVINLSNTYQSGSPPNCEEPAVEFGDFNFDGNEDVAISDGRNGGYGTASYQIYIYSKRSKTFVRSPSLTKITQFPSLGMLYVNRKKRMLSRFSKEGCCWHRDEGFAIVNGRPVKVYEKTEDAWGTTRGSDRIIVTVKKLINGRWKTSTKSVNDTSQ